VKCQRGQAFILVLIFLAVGALLIVPMLEFAFTGLRSQQVFEDALARLYAADAAVEDALWKLESQLMGTFDATEPQPVSYNFQLGANDLPVTIDVPSVPVSQDYGTGEVHHAMVEVVPRFFETPPGGGPLTFRYIVRFDEQKWALISFHFTLPQGLTYNNPSSYYKGPDGNAYLSWDAEVDPVNHQVKMRDGEWADMTLGNYVVVDQWPPPGGEQPNTSYLIVTTESDGRQTLEWRPYFGRPTGRRIFVQTCEVIGMPSWGVNYITDVSFEGDFGIINIDRTAATGVAVYTILVESGGVTYQVVVGYDSSTGTFKIISYQPLE